MLAVTADRSGFAAVGSAGNAPAVWTSPTGSAWQLTRLPLPAGAVSAVLTQVAAVGGRLVAAGAASRAAVAGQVAGPVPFAAVSGDGGRSWPVRGTGAAGPAHLVVTGRAELAGRPAAGRGAAWARRSADNSAECHGRDLDRRRVRRVPVRRASAPLARALPLNCASPGGPLHPPDAQSPNDSMGLLGSSPGVPCTPRCPKSQQLHGTFGL